MQMDSHVVSSLLHGVVEKDNNHEMVEKKMSLLQRLTGEFQEVQRCRFHMKRGHQRRMPLWLFIITVIKADNKQTCLAWTKTESFEFTVKDRDLLAKIWGLVKGNVSMDYSKLARALRYYYGKKIIEKVPSQPYTYRFILSENTVAYLPTKEELSSEFGELPRPPRTKSLPNFRSMFSQYVASNDDDCHAGSSNDNECWQSTVPGAPRPQRERTRSLPTRTIESGYASESVKFSESSSNGSESNSIDDFLDLEEAPSFFWERKPQKKALLTSCFMSHDLPLLQFEDLKHLDKELSLEASGCCSPVSGQGSSEMEICEDTSFWISEMTQNPDLKLSEMEGWKGLGNLLAYNENSSIKPAEEMEIVQQMISGQI